MSSLRASKLLYAPSPSSSSSSHSCFLFPSHSRSSLLPFSAGFPSRNKSRCGLILVRCRDSDTIASGGGSNPQNGNLPNNRRDVLLEYVRNVRPEFMELFMKRAPKQVVDAIRQTVTSMIGALPPQFFAVTVTTVAENLAQFMYSVMMTGYMFRTAQYRLELQKTLEQIALPDHEEKNEASDYAPGSQKKVTGEVIRWNDITGSEKMDAVKYIEYLEAELEELNRQIARRTENGQNELLDYLKSLEPQNLKDLTNSAGEDVVFAMNTFIKRLPLVSDPAQMKTSLTETSAKLANLLYWLMVVGYSLRNIEVRLDMERLLDAPHQLAELPHGQSIKGCS